MARSLGILASKVPRRLRLAAFVRGVQARGVHVADSMNALDVAVSLNSLRQFPEEDNPAFAAALQARGVEVVESMIVQVRSARSGPRAAPRPADRRAPLTGRAAAPPRRTS